MKTQILHATQCAACGAGASATEEASKGEALGTNLSILVLLSLIYGLGGIIVYKVVRMMKREDESHRSRPLAYPRDHDHLPGELP